VLAASRAGIKQVILPEENRKDWQEVPDEVRSRMRIQFVRHIAEVLPFALREK
jgi:ATP-dependent Lon protease